MLYSSHIYQCPRAFFAVNMLPQERPERLLGQAETSLFFFIKSRAGNVFCVIRYVGKLLELQPTFNLVHADHRKVQRPTSGR